MRTDENAPEENVEELRKRANAEQDLEKLLELVSKLKSLIEARSQKKA
jgi:primosomal protein N''